MSPLLEIRHLTVEFRRRRERLRAVDGVSLSVAEGECLALAGESGSGKSTIARVLTGLIGSYSGDVSYAGSAMPKGGRTRTLPWLQVQMVFQDPGSSLSPRKRIGKTLHELLAVHDLPRQGSREERVDELLKQVGLTSDVAAQLPKRLSGGQRQRAAIAAALAVEPRVLICDEAVSALDVSIRAQILQLLKRLQAELGLALLFITHDLAVVRQIADRTLIMYRGRILEAAPTRDLFDEPLHPYTRLLIDSIPSLDGPAPSHLEPPAQQVESSGCVFASRCKYATAECLAVVPPLDDSLAGRLVACHHWRAIRGPEDGAREPNLRERSLR